MAELVGRVADVVAAGAAKAHVTSCAVSGRRSRRSGDPRLLQRAFAASTAGRGRPCAGSIGNHTTLPYSTREIERRLTSRKGRGGSVLSVARTCLGAHGAVRNAPGRASFATGKRSNRLLSTGTSFSGRTKWGSAGLPLAGRLTWRGLAALGNNPFAAACSLPAVPVRFLETPRLSGG